ncbi:MAG: phosphoadenosine phosphosulfate reductase family protein [Nitrospirae bacterium]|nr:phosphoadenosine phosphosulfate reductase family protein [Nitrospirota bacterium]
MEQVDAGDGVVMNIVSYGGGVNSTAMTIFLINKSEVPDLIVFCDTGAELPATLEYVNYFSTWLKDNAGIEITTIRKDGEGLYDYCFRKRLVPMRQYRWCTSDWKIKPFDRYLKQFEGDKIVYIGYDAGEDGRVTSALSNYKKYKRPTQVFPLHEADIDREGCINIIKVEGLRLPLKSGCFICPFTKKSAFREMKRNNPSLFQKALDLEANCASGHVLRQGHPLTEIDNQCELNFDYDTPQPCGCYDGD